MRQLFRAADEITFELGDADRCFDVICALNFLERYKHAYDNDRDQLGPNIRANYEIGSAMSLADGAWAHGEQTRIFRRFQETFRDYDVVMSPIVPVSPFPWTQLYLAELEGEKLKNYYHWLALGYVVTLTTNPAIVLPCGIDDHRMPFGLQVAGRFGEGIELLDIASALERAFAGFAELDRPRRDVGALATARPELKAIVTDPPAQPLVAAP